MKEDKKIKEDFKVPNELDGDNADFPEPLKGQDNDIVFESI